MFPASAVKGSAPRGTPLAIKEAVYGREMEMVRGECILILRLTDPVVQLKYGLSGWNEDSTSSESELQK